MKALHLLKGHRIVQYVAGKHERVETCSCGRTFKTRR